MAQVVLPALPINMLYYCDDNSTQKKNNLCNIFPLSFFLDCFIRFWDLQKHYVAKQLHGHVTFIGRPDALIQENTRRRENHRAVLILVDDLCEEMEGLYLVLEYL